MPIKAQTYFPIFILCTLLFASTSYCYAQKGKIKAKGFQDITVTNMTGDLNFGTLIYNQGTVRIDKTDRKVVVLHIEGKQNQKVRVSFNAPTNLELDAANTMRFTLEAAYNDTGNDNAASAQPVDDPASTEEVFKLSKDKKKGPQKGEKKTGEAYLYIYGSVNVGQVKAGTYTGKINVSVQYD